MGYFKLGNTEETKVNKIIIIFSVCITCLGVVHWAYCIIINRFLSSFQDFVYKTGDSQLQMKNEEYKKLMNSPLAYFIINGIQQFVTSIIIILVCLQKIAINSKAFWGKFLAILLIINFSFNFTAAVQVSMTITYYNTIFQKFLDMVNSQENLDQWIYRLIVMIRFVKAQTILIWVMTLPLIGVILGAFIDNLFKTQQNLQAQISAKQMIQEGNK